MLPLLAHSKGSDTIVWHEGRAVSRAAFMAAAQALALELGPAPYVINLADGRLSFMLGFAAAALSDRITLLPQNQTAAALAEMQRQYPDHQVLDDACLSHWASIRDNPADCAGSAIPSSKLVAILFTSGSTGIPQPQPKTWEALARTGELDAARFIGSDPSRSDDRTINLVATVPSQHMFGLQTTVLLPLAGNCAIYDGRPFFPADIRDALLSFPAPRALVSTPVHLHACVASGISMPPVEFVLSATAPMPHELARTVEERWHTRVLEIYGSTEAGTIGTRRTTESDLWKLLPGACLRQKDGTNEYHAPHLPEPLQLTDQLVSVSTDEFRLLGRATDQIKVAGKRASLPELTHALQGIIGVADGIVFQPPNAERTAALAVAPQLAAAHILDELAKRIDPVFLPRPLILVPRLPRNAVGKITQAALLAALDEHKRRDD